MQSCLFERTSALFSSLCLESEHTMLCTIAKEMHFLHEQFEVELPLVPVQDIRRINFTNETTNP